jgi:hypothetical protein
MTLPTQPAVQPPTLEWRVCAVEPPSSGSWVTGRARPILGHSPTPAELARSGHSDARLLVTLTNDSRQLVEKRLRLFQIRRVEAFGEPAVDRGQKVVGFRALTLVAPERSKTCSSP